MVDTDPTHPYVTTTAAIPREGEGLVIVVARTDDEARNEPWKLTQVERQQRTIKTLQGMNRQQQKDTNKLKHKAERLLLEARKQRDDLREERKHLVAEIAKQSDLIAHYKIGEAGWQEEAKGLKAELAKRDETIAEKDQWIEGLRQEVSGLKFEIANGAATITSLRSQLARGAAIEAKVKELTECDRPSVTAGLTQVPCRLLNDLEALLASPSPGPGAAEPEGEPKRTDIMEAFEALRVAGGSAWDTVDDVRAFLGRDEDERQAKVARLFEAAKGAVDEYHSNFAHMRYEDSAMKKLAATLADLDATEVEREAPPKPLARIVIEEISPGLWKPTTWEGDRQLVSWEASTREGTAENVLAGMARRDSYQGIEL